MTRALLLVALALAGTGCLNLKPQPDPARFFVLDATVPPPATRAPGTVLGLGPVTYPGYLERAHVVTRSGTSEVRLAETDRWAETFPDMATRVLGDDLGAALASERVVTYPWQRTLSPAPVIEVRFARLERDSTGTAVLEADWRVRAGARDRVGHTRLSEPASAAGTAASAEALSRALGRFAAELADAARALGSVTP